MRRTSLCSSLLPLLLLPAAYVWRRSTLSSPLLLSPCLAWCTLLLLWLQLAAWVLLLLLCASSSIPILAYCKPSTLSRRRSCRRLLMLPAA
jgi:hypothetical protein